jgi:hypothetical protein
LEGVIKGRPSATITSATQIGLDLLDTISGKDSRLEACFGELADCADPIIPGFPELARFGYQVEEDDDGHIWVQFHKIGVTLLAETPDQEPARACRLRPVEPRVLEGPCVEVVDVYCLDDGARLPRWVCDDAWPGVKVVKRPVTVGPGKVVVAIEPGVRAVITGTRVPWQVREVTPEVAARAAISAQLTQVFGRRQAQASSDRAGYLLNEHGEKCSRFACTRSVTIKKTIGSERLVAMFGARGAMVMFTQGQGLL